MYAVEARRILSDRDANSGRNQTRRNAAGVLASTERVLSRNFRHRSVTMFAAAVSFGRPPCHQETSEPESANQSVRSQDSECF